MATKYNEIKLTARLTQEPRQISDKGWGARIAYDTGKYKTPSGFAGVTHWDPDSALKNLSKGAEITLTGSLEFDTWEHEGNKYSAVSVTAEVVEAAGA